jgi:hypothetical protein
VVTFLPVKRIPPGNFLQKFAFEGGEAGAVTGNANEEVAVPGRMFDGIPQQAAIHAVLE